MKTKIFTILAAICLLIVFSAEPADAKRKPKAHRSSSKHRPSKRHSSIQLPAQNQFQAFA